MSSLELDCRKCGEADKKNYGCTGIPAIPTMWEFEGEYLTRCPVRLLKRESLWFIKYYHFYKQGYLANEGSIGHQPAKLLEAFTVIDAEIDKIRSDKAEGKK